MMTTSGFSARSMTARIGKSLVTLHCATFQGADTGEVKTKLYVYPGRYCVAASLTLNAAFARLHEHFTKSRTRCRYECTLSLHDSHMRDATGHIAPGLLAAAFINTRAPVLIDSMLHVDSPGPLILYSNARTPHRRSRYIPSRGSDRYFVRV
jgi:hypothetical protein